jgi:hypothetical protein
VSDRLLGRARPPRRGRGSVTRWRTRWRRCSRSSRVGRAGMGCAWRGRGRCLLPSRRALQQGAAGPLGVGAPRVRRARGWSRAAGLCRRAPARTRARARAAPFASAVHSRAAAISVVSNSSATRANTSAEIISSPSTVGNSW